MAGIGLAFVGACASIGGEPPAFALETPLGTVRANDAVTAREAADTFVRFAATLSELAPDLRTPRLDVWVQRRIGSVPIGGAYTDSLAGITLHRGARGAFRILVEEERLREHLSHELVHAMLGPSWSTLPTVLEEGLCDSLGMDLLDRSARRLQLLAGAARLEQLPTTLLYRARDKDGSWEQRAFAPEVEYEPGVPYSSRLDLRQVLEIPSSRDLHDGTLEDTARGYSIGFAMVQLVRERGGLAALHQLCERARDTGLATVPAEWTLAAAGVQDESELRSQATRLIAEDPAAVLELLELPERAGLVRNLRARSGFATADAHDFFRHVQPRIQLFGGPPFALADLPGLVAWAAAEWEELAP